MSRQDVEPSDAADVFHTAIVTVTL